jgi:hypothetical protein
MPATEDSVHPEPYWPNPEPLGPRCSWDGPEAPCFGARFAGFDRCVAHLDPRDLEQSLARLRPGADLDISSGTISGELFARILSALRGDEDGPRFGRANFYQTRFEGNILFGGAIFEGHAGFASAIFAGETQFDGLMFLGNALFDRATFVGKARFGGMRFDGTTSFKWAQFQADAWFDGAWFVGDTQFVGATFDGDARFDARFQGDTTFAAARFADGARFNEAMFEGDVIDLSGVRLHPTTSTLQCECNEIDASGLHWSEELNIQLSGAIDMDASKVRSKALTLRLADGNLTVMDASFTGPAIIASPTRIESSIDAPPAPRLLSLARVDATNLTLAGLDLSACRFLACYNRDQLRIDGRSQFAAQPPGWRWTRRQVLAEEHRWRARYRNLSRKWFPERCRWPDEGMPGRGSADQARSEAAQIQMVYRDLRKGREDSKDEPGAADFYYGEMEMRRFAAAPLSVERGLLTVYWAVAGYGLRASRSLAALAVLLLLAMAGFATVGFAGKCSAGYLDSLLYAAGSVLSLDLASQHAPGALTHLGEVFRILLRVAGPVCLALAALAVRGRVKR